MFFKKITFNLAVNSLRILAKGPTCIKTRQLHYDGWYDAPSKEVKPFIEDSTVLVLGWAGAQQKHVQSYSRMYAGELGLGAHGYTLPMELTFSYDQDAQKKLAQDMIEVVSKENTGKRLFLHCFSNNGLNFYKHVSKLLKDKPNGLIMSGGILDSCPGPMSYVPYHAQKLGITSVHDKPIFFPFMMLPGVYGYFQFTEAKKSLPVAMLKGIGMIPASFKNYFKYGGSDEWSGNYIRNVENENWPLLFLYSKTDALMAYMYVSEVVKEKKKQNPKRIIQSKLFEKSPHVAHMRKYPEEYRHQVKTFLEQCDKLKAKL